MKSYFSDADSPFDRRKAVEELVKGHGWAVQLQNLIDESKSSKKNGSDQVINQDLVFKILDSFSNTLSILKNEEEDDDHHSDEAISQIMTNTQLSSPQDNSAATDDQSSKISTPRDRRGCYKRRKSSASWTKVTVNLIDDGHAWRKYGQKKILHASYPRSYFRCTHKYEQGCDATKQVQQISENPSMYRSIYYGHHTCQNFIGSSQLIIDSTNDVATDCTMISFGDKTQNHNSFTTSSSPFLNHPNNNKHHDHEMLPSDDYNHRHHLPSSSSTCPMSPDPTTIGESSLEKFRSTPGLEYSDDIIIDDYLHFQSQFDELYGC